MRVLFISQYYHPEPVEKVHDLARGLVRLGHDVQVVTGFPCYPKGEIYEGYRGRLTMRETIDGVDVFRIPQYPDHSQSALRRIGYYVSFAASAALAGSVVVPQPDVVLVYLAALPVGLAGLITSRVRGCPLVLDVVDIWPESVASSGMMEHPVAMETISRIAAMVYHGSDAISAVTHGFRERIVGTGVSDDAVHVIHNWMPSATYRRPTPTTPVAQPDEPHDPRRFVVCYAGNIGPYQDLGTLIDAAELLRSAPHIEFMIVGDGIEYAGLRKRAEASGLDRVTFYGRRAPSEMPALFAQADALFVHLKPGPLTDVTIPSKTFAYMATGKPILMAVRGEATDFVDRYGLGVNAPPGNPEALAKRILEMAAWSPERRREVGRHVSDVYARHFSGEVQIARFSALLEETVRTHRRSH